MIRQIRYFQSVVRNHSFTEAVDECFISQSAISQQVQALENELGVKLIRREGRKFSLTEAGEYFYEKSLQLTADYDRLCRQTRKIASRSSDFLSVGCLRGYAGTEFSQAVSRYCELFPDSEIQIMSGTHEELYNGLLSGKLDLVLSDQRRAFSQDYENLVLTRRPCWIELSNRHPLASRPEAEAADLKDYACLLCVPEEQQQTEKEYYQLLLGTGSHFEYSSHIEEARLRLLSSQSYIPLEAADGPLMSVGNLHRMPVVRNGKPILRTYCAFWKKDNPGQTERFAEILKQQFVEENTK